MDRKDVESLFHQSRDLKILVIGDLMLDEYLWGKAERISPEAPVQVVDITREDLRLGGAGNVVNNLVAFGCSVSVCSVIGADDNGTILRHVFTGMGVNTDGVLEDPMRSTSKKTRVLAANQQIVRIDRETKLPVSTDYEDRLCTFVRESGPEYQAIILSDYAKGVLTDRLLSEAIQVARSVTIPVLVDPKGSRFEKYSGATILTPNRREAEIASGVAICDEASLSRAARTLMDGIDLQALLITRSEEGMSLFLRDGSVCHIPTTAREVFDVTGAGDTVLSMLGLALASGREFADAAALANVAAGIAVGKVGTSTVSPREIVEEVSHGHRDSDTKIKNIDVLSEIISAEKDKGKRVVFTNGCFDLLHVGHVKYLQKARTFGDLLVLGLNSDDSIRRLKGEERPLISQDERAHVLAALDCIDYVVIFDEDTPIRLIEALRPSILVKGGDYSLDGVVGRDLVESYGGRVELVEFVSGKSTTNIIEKIRRTGL